MNYETFQTVSHFLLLTGLIIAALGGFGGYYFKKKSDYIRAQAALKQENIPKEEIGTSLEESKETQKLFMPFEELARTRYPDKEIKEALEALTRDIDELMPFEELALTRSPNKEIKGALEALIKDLDEVSAHTQQNELITSLKNVIQEETNKIASLKNAIQEKTTKISSLGNVIQEKAIEVEGLINTVDSLKKHVTHLENKQEELTNKISNLKSELNFKEKEVSRKELEIKKLHHEINTIFYVIGNSKELRRKKIIDKKGIPLLRSLNPFSRNYVLGSDFTLAEFKQEKATLTKLRIDGKIKKLLPYRNKNHYDISYENGLSFINIKDSKNFWHQKYLVVVTW